MNGHDMQRQALNDLNALLSYADIAPFDFKFTEASSTTAADQKYLEMGGHIEGFMRDPSLPDNFEIMARIERDAEYGGHDETLYIKTPNGLMMISLSYPAPCDNECDGSLDYAQWMPHEMQDVMDKRINQAFKDELWNGVYQIEQAVRSTLAQGYELNLNELLPEIGKRILGVAQEKKA